MPSVYRTIPSDQLWLAAGEYATRVDRLQIFYAGRLDIPDGQFITAYLYVGGGSNGGIASSGAPTLESHSLAANGESSSAVAYWHKSTSIVPTLLTSFDVISGHSCREFNFSDLGGFTAPAGWGTYVFVEAYQSTPDGTISTNVSGAFRIGAYFAELDD